MKNEDYVSYQINNTSIITMAICFDKHNKSVISHVQIYTCDNVIFRLLFLNLLTHHSVRAVLGEFITPPSHCEAVLNQTIYQREVTLTQLRLNSTSTYIYFDLRYGLLRWLLQGALTSGKTYLISK